MANRSPKKLTLHRETLSSLSDGSLANVRGGHPAIPPVTFRATCPAMTCGAVTACVPCIISQNVSCPSCTDPGPCA